MVRGLIQALRERFEERERFLIVELFDHAFSVSACAVCWPRKRITFERHAEAAGGWQDIAGRGAALRRIAARFGAMSRYHVLVAADPALATTIHSAVSLIREKPQEPIDETEFDTMVGHALWKLFDRARGRAARKMGAGDVDVLLSDARVKRIRLDGHRVSNPIGFCAKAAEFQISELLSVRELTTELRSVFAKAKSIAVAENGVLHAETAARMHGADTFLLANVFPERTDLFFREGAALAFLDSFAWGAARLGRAVGEHFTLSAGTAEELFRRALAGDASPLFLRKFERLIVGELQLFANGLGRQLADVGAKTVYVNPFGVIPSLVETPAFGRRVSRAASLRILHGESLLRELGFTAVSPPRVRLTHPFSTLAVLFGFHFLPRHDTIVETAVARHARWLGGA